MELNTGQILQDNLLEAKNDLNPVDDPHRMIKV